MRDEVQRSADAYIRVLARQERRKRRVWAGGSVLIAALVALLNALRVELGRIVDLDVVAFVAAMVVLAAAGVVAAHMRRASEARKAERAFGFTLDQAGLEENSERLAALRQRISKVCVMSVRRLPESTDYTVLVVDSAGETYEVDRTGEGEQARDTARWFADRLEKPLDDTTS